MDILVALPGQGEPDERRCDRDGKPDTYPGKANGVEGLIDLNGTAKRTCIREEPPGTTDSSQCKGRNSPSKCFPSPFEKGRNDPANVAN
jgi:hypothetical protein